MKKFLPIIIGILAGAVAAVTLNYTSILNTAYGDEWDENGKGFDCYFQKNQTLENLKSCGDVFDWQSIFSPIDSFKKTKISDLYAMLYKKMSVNPQVQAAQALAEKYGISTAEAENIMAGGFIRGNDDGAHMLSQTEVLNKAESMRTDFTDAQALFDIQAELESTVMPTEIFANGDLADSGFDLVYDLSAIEEILFKKNTEPSVGTPYGDPLPTPLPPDYTSSGPSYDSGSGSAGSSGSSDDNLSSNTTPLVYEENGQKFANLKVGDTEVKTQVLENDICPDDGATPKSALDEFEADNADSGGSGGGSSGDDDDDGGSGGDDEDAPIDKNGDGIPEAKAEDWFTAFCPGTTQGKGSDSIIQPLSVGGASGDAPEEDEAYVNPQFSFCLIFEMVYDKVSAGKETSCIKCEVDAMLGLFSDVFEHSLVTNKVTGNILEPAKCKASIDISGGGIIPDIKFIMMTAAVTTPPKDDMILKGNILGEWNKFVDKIGWNKPKGTGAELWFSKFYSSLKAEQKFAEQFAIKYPGDNTDLSGIVNNLRNTMYALTGQTADVDDEKSALLSDMEDNKLYNDTIFDEMYQMRLLFQEFQRYFNMIVETPCKELFNKRNVTEG